MPYVDSDQEKKAPAPQKPDQNSSAEQNDDKSKDGPVFGDWASI